MNMTRGVHGLQALQGLQVTAITCPSLLLLEAKSGQRGSSVTNS